MGTRFEELPVWKASRELTRDVYAATLQKAFARDVRLASQIQAAAVSVMSNVAEGFESETHGEFTRALYHSKKSAGEVRSQLYVALDQGHITQEHFKNLKDLTEDVTRQLGGLIRHLKNKMKERKSVKPGD